MLIYKTKEFARLARKAKLTDDVLCATIRRVEEGQIDAQIGKFLIKQRIASEGRGKAKAFRAVICHMVGTRAVFLHLFSKSDAASLTPHETETWRDLAKVIAQLDGQLVKQLVERGEWIEIDHDEEVPE